MLRLILVNPLQRCSTIAITFAFLLIPLCAQTTHPPPCPPTPPPSNDPPGHWVRSPLHDAALVADLQTVEKLIAAGADVNARDSRGDTPLLATLFPTVSGPSGIDSPERTAAKRRAHDHARVQVGLALLQHNADPNAPGRFGQTPLMMLSGAYYIHADEVYAYAKALIAAGAKLDQQDWQGSTALMYAAANNRTAIVRLLLNKGADKSIADCHGETALRTAEKKKYSAITELLQPAPRASEPRTVRER